jgi:transcriptional regulator with XRE-family HTH domain
MSTTYGAFIKRLRTARGWSQLETAKTLKMSRPSYVALEKGTKELSLSEADGVARLFGITIEQLLKAQAPDIPKYKQMILAFLREARASKATLKKTKLAKLLYFADFAWYYYHLESMSGMSYRRIEFGPVPDAYFSLVEDLEQKGHINVTQVARDGYHMYELAEARGSMRTPLSLLSKKELALIHDIWTKWKDANTNEIVNFTHNQMPYQFAEDNSIVSYEIFIQEDPAEIY